MIKPELPSCPYCGKPLNFFEGFVLKSHGEYHCSACGNRSKVTFRQTMYKRSWICEALALAFALILLIFTPSKSLWSAFFVFLPFLCFYVLVPFDIVLKQTTKSQANTNTQTGASVDLLSINPKQGIIKISNLLGLSHLGNHKTKATPVHTKEIPLPPKKRNSGGHHKKRR